MIVVKEFGRLSSGQIVYLYTITNSRGSSVTLTNFGGRIVSLKIHDKTKELRDVVLGYDTLEEYVVDEAYFGATIGRYANRIKNGEYVVNNERINLTKNDGENSIHGGIVGFDKVVWDAFVSGQDGEEKLTLKYHSVDGEQGYNGNMDVIVTYAFTSDDTLIMDIFAFCDQTTICNICNHTYFNLDGDGEKLFYHKVRIFADSILEIDDELLPTGAYLPLSGAIDLRKGRQLRTLRSRHSLIKSTGGYDFNYCINRTDGYIARAATVRSLLSGIKLDVYTTKPGVQFYTANSLNNVHGKSEKVYNKQTGFCLETQYYPDSPNHNNFPSVILPKGSQYKHRTIYAFSRH